LVFNPLQFIAAPESRIVHVDRLRVEDAFLPTADIAEVVGSNYPTRSISFILVNYGIESQLFWVVVGENLLFAAG
jgi:hypothetical protein